MSNYHLQRRQYDQEEITQSLLDIFEYYRSFREQYEQDAVKWYKMFIGYRENNHPNKANVNIPKAYQVLDTIRSQIVSNFFNKRPFIEFTPMPEAGDSRSFIANEDKAKVAASIVDEQLERSKITKEFYDFVTSMLYAPAGIMAVGWRYEKDMITRKAKVPEIDPQTGYYTGRYIWDIVESEEVVYDDNEVKNIDFFDFWPDPEANDFQDGRGCFHREYVTLEELKNRYEKLHRAGEGIIYEIDLDKISNLDKKKSDDSSARTSAVGRETSGKDPYRNADDQKLEAKSEVELLHYWEDDRHSIIINREKCMYDGPNPYWRHRQKPFVMASYDSLPNEIYGLSGMQVIHDLAEEINTIHNQRLDNASMLINNMWLRLSGSQIKDEDLVSRPNGIIDVDSMEDLQKLEMGDIPRSAFTSEDILHRNLEQALGTPPILRGVEGKSGATATEVSTMNENALGRFEAKIRVFEELCVNDIARMMDLNNQQFITDHRVAKLDLDDVSKWREIEPGDLIGEFDYSPAKTSVDAAANKDLRRQQMTEALGFLMQAEVPFIDYEEFVLEWLKTFDIQNPEKYFLSPEEKQQMQQQYMQELSGVEGNQPGPNSLGSTGGGLGRGQISRPNNVAGGMTDTGQPQPQPLGQLGGANYTSRG